MAKVTLTLEDIENEGKPAIRLAIKSDNNESDDVTMAEALAAELFEAVQGLTSGDLRLGTPTKSDNESLN
jgi:hypothetical protein